MKTTKRFTEAVTKLYNAFHNGTLNADDSCGCACGNLCNNQFEWNGNRNTTDSFDNIPEKYQLMTGYSHEELRNIEYLFMFGVKKGVVKGKWMSKDVKTSTNKDLVFKALCAVVEYLCELDGIPNVMDYSKLFETEDNKPKYELQLS